MEAKKQELWLNNGARLVTAAVCVAFVLFIAAFEYWEHVVLAKKAELNLSREFVANNPATKVEFGEITGIDRNSRFEYSTNLSDSNGYFGFSVVGTKGRGSVTVYWRYSSTSKNYEVTRYVLDEPLEKARELPIR
jgi:hypothetical protein